MPEKRRFICQEGTSNKFWEIEVIGNATKVVYGRIGSGGTNSDKVHKDGATARLFAEKEIAGKLKKGYILENNKNVLQHIAMNSVEPSISPAAIKKRNNDEILDTIHNSLHEKKRAKVEEDTH